MRSSTSAPTACRSLVHCGVCGRRMTGTGTTARPTTAARYPSEYAGATGKHPNTVYLARGRRDAGPRRVAARLFDPKNLDATVAALAAAQEPDDGAAARAEAARPGWPTATPGSRSTAPPSSTRPRRSSPGGSREVEAERLGAERELAFNAPRPAAHRGRAPGAGDLTAQGAAVPGQGDPRAACGHLQRMGLRLTYNPDEPGSVMVEAAPEICTRRNVGGPIRQVCYQSVEDHVAGRPRGSPVGLQIAVRARSGGGGRCLRGTVPVRHHGGRGDAQTRPYPETPMSRIIFALPLSRHLYRLQKLACVLRPFGAQSKVSRGLRAHVSKAVQLLRQGPLCIDSQRGCTRM